MLIKPYTSYQRHRIVSIAATLRFNHIASERSTVKTTSPYSSNSQPWQQKIPSHYHITHQSLLPPFSTRSLSIRSASSKSKSRSKVVTNITPVLDKYLFPGALISIGGFSLCGIPETLIHKLETHEKAKDLTIASMTAGIDGFGLGKLFEVEGKVKRIIATYVGENKVS